jgi:hypothetical protein
MKCVCANSVHAHAAAALINFCEGVERETLLPYLDPIVERLLRLLNPTPRNSDGNGGSDAGAGAPPKPVKRYVQEQAVTTLAVVADASEMSFVKVRARARWSPRDALVLIDWDSIIRRLCRCCCIYSTRRLGWSIGS